MTAALPFTPEIAWAMASDYLKREEQFAPPDGATANDFIIGKSPAIVFDISALCNAEAFGTAFRERVAGLKANLRDGLVKSGWAESHREAGFQFVVFLCDENGHPNIDLTTNQSTGAFGVAFQARLFAREATV